MHGHASVVNAELDPRLALGTISTLPAQGRRDAGLASRNDGGRALARAAPMQEIGAEGGSRGECTVLGQFALFIGLQQSRQCRALVLVRKLCRVRLDPRIVLGQCLHHWSVLPESRPQHRATPLGSSCIHDLCVQRQHGQGVNRRQLTGV